VAAAYAQEPNGTVGKHHKRIIFPVIGRTFYTDDFGAPRPGGSHQGIDIMAPRKSLAVAAESGKVEFWTQSAPAGCMLYLHGKSGTTYLYIHLNNDKTNHNDNRGKCGPGMSYAPHLRDGARVQAGQVIGFVGDSGDANGIHPHLHFEVHPHDGRAVDPYPYLNKGRRLLFGTLGAKPVKLSLVGKVSKTNDQFLRMRVRSLVVKPGKLHVRDVSRSLTVYVPVDAVISAKQKGRSTTATVSLSAAKKDRGLKVGTIRQEPTLALMRGQPNQLTAAKILLAAPK
jgi:Peptidase family M23